MCCVYLFIYLILRVSLLLRLTLNSQIQGILLPPFPYTRITSESPSIADFPGFTFVLFYKVGSLEIFPCICVLT